MRVKFIFHQISSKYAASCSWRVTNGDRILPVFLFCPVLVGFACTKFMHRTYMCCHSKWDETNFAHMVVNWDCANNSGLAVRWNFIVEKTLGEKRNPVQKNLEEICPESFFQVSNPVAFRITFLTLLFGVWDLFLLFYALLACLRYL